MKFPIFIFGTGRCGSTLLLRILNTHPDIHIEGEHGGFLNSLAHAYHTLRHDPHNTKLLYGPRVDESWQKAFRPEHVDAEFRGLIERLLFRDRDVPHPGFKEIRYNNEKTIVFLETMFPEGKRIIIHRNPLDVLVSMARTWRGGSIHPSDITRVVREASFLRTVSGFHLEYDSLSDDDVRRMFDHIGLSAPDAALGQIRQHKRDQNDPLRIEAARLIKKHTESFWKYIAAYWPHELARIIGR